jgi:oligoribonuclease
MDLEMTGLDPARNVIVEIATIVTDDELNIVAEGPDLVIGATPEQLADMDDVVVKMHTASGLLTAIGESKVTVEEAAAATLEFVKSQEPTAASVPLCGNSIAMDRSFLKSYMPALDEYFHYRSIDVSSVKELCKRWYRDAYAARPQKATAHRALDDIRESVAELRFYREHLFRTLAEVQALAPVQAADPAPAPEASA